MTDYLLVHGAGQGAWSWGSVWGYLTAPEDHPPTLDEGDGKTCFVENAWTESARLWGSVSMP